MLDRRQEDWDDLRFTLLARFTGLNASGSRRHSHLVFRDRGAPLAVYEDINNI